MISIQEMLLAELGDVRNTINQLKDKEHEILTIWYNDYATGIENMNTIKFSHKYEKMPKDVNHTWLMEVLTANREDLHDEFVNYDTEFEMLNRVDHYILPKGKLIILILCSYHLLSKNVIWTTVRRWTAEKETYYRSLRGQQVKIEVQE